MSYLFTLVLSLLGLHDSPTAAKAVDDQALIARKTSASATDAAGSVQITQDGFAAFFHS